MKETKMVNLPFKLSTSNILKGLIAVSLVVATILISVIAITHKSVSNGNQELVLRSAGNSSEFNYNDEDLTIVGLLGHHAPKFWDFRLKDPIVRVRRQGSVRGTVLKSREGREYFAFYQVPYARDPVGDLRFEPPKKPRRWRGLLDGRKPGVECLQKEKYAAINTTGGEEACLHVNIYTPKLPHRGKEVSLPVLFYVHGGGPFGNGTRYGAKYFMDKDVVLVTVEYRLGAFGSFVTESGSFSGNQGFKDQVFALKWVKTNIDKFGGNPNNVLLFGNSAGSAAVHAHLLSTMSRGLYHKAMMQSGSTLTTGLSVSNPLAQAKILAIANGCGHEVKHGSEKDLLSCLRKADAKEMAMGYASLMSSGIYPDVVAPENWQGSLEANEIFLTNSSWNLIHGEGLNRVPLIVGLVSQEQLHGPLGTMLTSENGTHFLNNHWNEFFPLYTGIKDDENHTIAQAFRRVYFRDQPISNETRVSLFNFQSDFFMSHACRQSGMLYANHSSAPVYFYWMTKAPAKSYGASIRNIFPPPYGSGHLDGGPAHADELQYLFLYDGYPEIGKDSPWYEFSKRMVDIWASFAETGKPMPNSNEWPPIDLRDRGMKWYQLGDEMGINEPFTERMTMWDRYTNELYDPAAAKDKSINNYDYLTTSMDH